MSLYCMSRIFKKRCCQRTPSQCVWALTCRPETLLISLTNWVKVVRSPHPSTSSSMEIRGCPWIWEKEKQQGGCWRAHAEREDQREGIEEMGRNQSPLRSAPSTSPFFGTPTGLADVMSEFDHLSSTSLTSTEIHTLTIRGSNSTNGYVPSHAV